jgi:uncharacterized protein YodC (DUF2158 family)
MPFEAGDIVYLKSGSPPLTVVSWDSGQIWVTWFERDAPNNLRAPPECFTKELPATGNE